MENKIKKFEKEIVGFRFLPVKFMLSCFVIYIMIKMFAWNYEKFRADIWIIGIILFLWIGFGIYKSVKRDYS